MKTALITGTSKGIGLGTGKYVEMLRRYFLILVKIDLHSNNGLTNIRNF